MTRTKLIARDTGERPTIVPVTPVPARVSTNPLSQQDDLREEVRTGTDRLSENGSRSFITSDTGRSSAMTPLRGDLVA